MKAFFNTVSPLAVDRAIDFRYPHMKDIYKSVIIPIMTYVKYDFKELLPGDRELEVCERELFKG